MEIATKITPPSWMTAPQSAAVIAALGAENALFVGGCVRNTLAEKAVKDIDIATRLLPEDVIARLEKAGIKTIPTGLEHGTVTAIVEGRPFEITTLRRDVETDGRRATVSFTQSWEEDAARRDFTINTLLADSAGNIYDPLGCGLADLAAGRVVFVGDPATRIAEDYLRVLRFFRFYALYGTGAPDRAALDSCAAAADKIGSLSRERVTQEFLKILMTDRCAAILKLMFEWNILKKLTDSKYDSSVLERLARLQALHEMPDVITRLCVLTDDLARLERFLILSNAQKKEFLLLINMLNEITNASDKQIKILIYRHGAVMAGQALLLHAARLGRDVDMTLIKNWTPPVFPITGDDIIAAGIPAGPAVGAALQKLEQWWLENDMAPNREECLGYVKKNAF